MGIFEKSIPKYVVNPMSSTVEVAPQDVYVDDIFDPVFNARVKDALRQKYGGGLYGLAGGYSELLKNAWGGEGGILGKGMGVLSTFGRSMEKADDIVLGLLTEGVEGITGQGFDNPLKNIFVNDEDYSGKRLLASAANTFRGLAGTTVSEKDFGTAWNLPALSLELGTDVGILGGGLARKFAPTAKDFTSKELFQRLGKSDLHTSLGEVGQLMSNYDDLMSRIAIDITAPGLRPAFKKVMNKMGDLFAHQSSAAYVDAIRDLKIVEDDTLDDAARLAAQQHLANNPVVKQAVGMFEEPSEKLSKIPEETFDVEVLEEGAEEPAIERMMNALKRDISAEAFAKRHYEGDLEKLRDTVRKTRVSWNRRMNRKFEKAMAEADALGWKTATESSEEVTKDLDSIRRIVTDAVGDDWGFIKHPRVQYTSDELAYLDMLKKARDSKDYDTINNLGTLFPEVTNSLLYKTRMSPVEAAHTGYVDQFKRSVKGINKEYAGEVMSKLESDEALIEALETGEWTSNDAANKAISRAIYGLPYFKHSKSPYRVSPSMLSAVKSSGASGNSYAYTLFNKINTLNVKTGKKIFASPEELEAFFDRPSVAKKLEAFIPARPLPEKYKGNLNVSGIAKKEEAFAKNRRAEFVKLLSDVYFPKEGIKQYDYTKSLIALEDFVSKYVNPDIANDSTRFLKTLTPKELREMSENPESVLSPLDFLTKSGLAFTDADGLVKYRNSGTTEALGAELFLTGNLPMEYKYPSNNFTSRMRSNIQRSGARLKKQYEAELAEISEKAKTAKPNKYDKLFDKLYTAIDDVSMNYLQVIRDEIPHHLKGVDASYSLDKALRDSPESTTTFADILESADIDNTSAKAAFRPKNRLDDEYATAPTRHILDWFRNTVPANATPDQVHRVAKHLADYVDIGYKTGANIPITDKELKIVNTFYSNVVPVIERITSNPKFRQFNLSQIFAKKDLTATIKNEDLVKDIKYLRNMLGAPSAEAPDKFSKYYNRLFNDVVKKYPTENFEFKPKHSGLEVDLITDFLSKPKSPSELMLEMHSRFNNIAVGAAERGQSFKDLKLRTELFDSNLYDILDDLGTSAQKMDEVFDKIRKHGTSSLDAKELTLYRAYTHRVSQFLSNVPYRAYYRQVGDFGPESNWRGIRDNLSSWFKTEHKENFKGVQEHIIDPNYVRAEQLLNREFNKTRKILSGKGTTELSTMYRYTDDELKFVADNIIPKLPANVKPYWKPSHKDGLFYFDFQNLGGVDDAFLFPIGKDVDVRPERFQIESFLKNVDEKYRKDLNDIMVIDYGTLYSKSGRQLLTDNVAKTTVRMNLIDNPEARLVDIYKKSFDRYKPSTRKAASNAASSVKEVITNQAPEETAAQAYNMVGTASALATEAIATAAESAKQFADGGGTDAAGEVFNGKRQWRWFKIIKDSLAVSDKNSHRASRATLRTRVTTALGKRFDDFTRRLNVDNRYKDFKRFYILRQQQIGDTVKGSDFWTTFRRTGILIAPYEATSKQLPKVEAALRQNAELINKAANADIVEVLTKEYGTGQKAVVMRFTGDTKTVKYVKKSLKNLENAKYADVEFSPPKALSESDTKFIDSDDMRELTGLMEELQNVAADQARFLGFTFDNATPYTHHAMKRDTETAKWLNEQFYDKISSEDYDDLSKLISNFDEYRKTDRGAFGTMLQDRRFRGDYWLLDNGTRALFEYDPSKVFTSTLADGMFANLQYQDFTDLFINDNFKIKDWFKTPDDLKEVLYAKDSKGKISGNLRNSELVSFKLDDNGKIVGLIKYDKMSDAGLAKALADENTILVPANAVSHMDNVLRKDVRMNNKFWTFINKHLTIPFKFGLLSNPGFLLGNMSDSTLKLATTMSEKYGTTVTREAKNVAECINASQVLKNNYYEAFDLWKKVSEEYNIKLSPEATVADIVAMSPKYKEDFLLWLDDSLEVPITFQNDAGKWITEYRHVPCELPKNVINDASIWTMLQGVQMNSNKMREFADLAEIAPQSRFDVATNWFDRITQGNGKYNWKKPSTWGLFMNNPPMKALTDASGGWEDIIRTASILDDLRHGQLTKEDFAKFARGSAGSEDSILMRVRLDEAKNAMFNAQFDYERQSDFISKIGQAVPFPIFFLKNFAYWMELFDKNPQFVDNVIDIQEGLWSGYNEDNDKFMTEAKGRGAIPVGGYALPKWFKGVYKPSPLQSMFGAFSLLNNPIDDLSYRSHPLIGGAKAAVTAALPDSDLTTLLQDPESVKYRPYSTNMYERNIKQGDPKFNPLEYTVHRINPFERAVNTYLRVPAKAKEGDLQLSDALPSVFQPMF